ncbi:MAG: sarcosine oxidase subunit delta [Hyphomicrobium sp.]
MRITCPYCGERSLDEFVFLGDAAPTRPDPAAPTALEDFASFVFERDNRAGVNEELWQHAAGCRVWLVVTRSALTHVISGVAVASDVALRRRRPRQGSGA